MSRTLQRGTTSFWDNTLRTLMTEVFADTSGWANYFVRSEPFSQLAVSRMRQWYATGDRLVTTNYILIELVALMTSPLRIPRPNRSEPSKQSKLRRGWR
jgi:hypothetical protein